MKKVTKARLLFSLIAVVIVSGIVSFLVFTKPANAAVASVVQKWVLAMHYNCILDQNGAAEPISVESSRSVADTMYPNDTAGQPLPSLDYFAGDIRSENGRLTCRQVLEGDGILSNDIDGIFQIMNVKPKAAWHDMGDVRQLVEKLGYDAGDDGVRIAINENRYNEDGSGDGIRFEVSDSLNATFSNGSIDYRIDYSYSSALAIKDIRLKMNEAKTKLEITFSPYRSIIAALGGTSCGIINNKKVTETADLSKDNIFATIESIQNAINRINGETNFKENCQTNGTNGQAASISNYLVKLALEDPGAMKYELKPDRPTAAANSIKRLTGGSVADNVALKGDELYDLYTYYLTHAANYDASKLDCHNKSGKEIPLKVGDEWVTFYVNDAVGANEVYWTMNGDGTFGWITIDGIIDALKFLSGGKARTLGDSEPCPNPEIGAQIKNTTVDPEKGCFSSADSLGWIICPIMEGLRKTVEGLYDAVVEPLLEIDIKSFDRNSDAYKAWQLFQSFANIIFVILFLVVIISQITGVGIDNLGIKRILPKLVVAAVLVNLSFIICMLLVDASNIVGHSAKTIFDGFDSTGTATAYRGQGAVNGLLTAITAGGGVTIAAVTWEIWVPMIILPLLLGLITMVISILTMFVLLGVYQAGVIAAVIVSPVAFVLYMLPNTKSIFDKWKKIFQALLLLYPICGFMMGMSAFVGKIIQNVSDGFFMTLLGALLAVVPFFFIPKILKSTMSAMGSIGAKIAGIGQNLSGRATKAIGNNEAVKDWNTRLRAGVDKDGNLTRIGKRYEKLAKKDTIRGRAAKRRWNRNLAAWAKADDRARMNPDNIITAQEDKKFKEELDVAKSKNIQSGAYENVGQMDEEDFANGKAFAEGSLAAQLYDPNSSKAEKYAAVSQMMAQKPGHEALHQVFQRLGEEGRMDDIATIARAAKTDPKFGELKDKNLSTVDYINAVGMGDVASGETINSRIGKTNFKGLSDEDFAKLSKEEMTRYAEGVKSGAISGESADALRSKVEGVKNNNILYPKVKDNVKDQYDEILKAMGVGSNNSGSSRTNSGYAQEGKSFGVPRNGDSSQSSPIATPGSDEYNQLNDDFKNGKL